MNDLVFVIALMYEKGLLTHNETVKLHKVATEQTMSSSLREMQDKIKLALDGAGKSSGVPTRAIDAKDLFNKNLARPQ
jgi:hypothetical protein